MRAYAKDMAMLAECRRQMEKFLSRDQPELKPSERRAISKHYVMKAYTEMKREVPKQRTDGVLPEQERSATVESV